MVELDNLDVKILAHLQSNSGESFQEINLMPSRISIHGLKNLTTGF